ncbi:DUF2283 domain-containing protein [Candidatus Uhrbacteria bacterium]|nr:DUF2283 domain-containing protein [Candidatus Uhrbacteria bacterium]
MARPKTTKKISYEKEADVLRVELAKAPIDYATELGPLIIHFSKRGLPVYIEILEASKFLRETQKAFVREGVFALPRLRMNAPTG